MPILDIQPLPLATLPKIKHLPERPFIALEFRVLADGGVGDWNYVVRVFAESREIWLGGTLAPFYAGSPVRRAGLREEERLIRDEVVVLH
jgi:hypothetical protein